MEHAPAASAVLEAWERGHEQGPVERGLTLLALGAPNDAPDALAALGIGERDRRLLALREALFGAHAVGLVACARCGEQVELEFETRDLLAAAPATARLRLRRGRDEVRLRLPDSRDLQAAAAAGPDDAASVLLERCVVSARVAGRAVRADGLPEGLVAGAARRLADADPLLDARFPLTCPACAHAWSAPFDVVPFLWAEIDAWTGRLFADVHVLASAYGWTEADVLALSAARRRSYIRMASA